MSNRALNLITGSLEKWAGHLARSLSHESRKTNAKWLDGDLVYENGAPLVVADGKLGTETMEISLPAELVAVHEMELPRGAHDHVAGIVRNKLPQISPWPVEKLFYGFSVPNKEQQDAPQGIETLTVSVAMIDAETALGNHRGLLANTEQGASRIILKVHEEAESRTGSAIFLRRFGTDQFDPFEKSANIYKNLLAAGLFLIGAGYATQTGMEYWRDSSLLDLDLRQSEIRLALQTSAQVAAEVNDPLSKTNAEKYRIPGPLIVLNHLAAILPDTAHLVDLQIIENVLSFSVVSDDSAMILRSLADTSVFEEVAFTAPSVRDAQTGRETSQLTARISVSRQAGEELMQMLLQAVPTRDRS